MQAEITPLILTYNEAPNIDRTLKRLVWADKIVVVDSYSTDDTLSIVQSYPQVQLFQRQFDTHANQWNYGLEQIQTEWVLSLDADYQLSEELIAEIKALPQDTLIDSYLARFKYCVYGKPVRSTVLPPREVLFRKAKAIYIDDGHTQRLRVDGTVGKLSAYIYHDDRKPLSRWIWAQDRYMLLEVKKLRETPSSDLRITDRVRTLKIVAPFLVLFYCLIIKGGLLDGWAGWYYAFQRFFAETLLSIRLLEAELTDDR